LFWSKVKVEIIKVIIIVDIHEFNGYGPHCLSLLTVLMLWVAYIVVGMVDKFVITPQENHE
jgi:hypothetical protein